MVVDSFFTLHHCRGIHRSCFENNNESGIRRRDQNKRSQCQKSSTSLGPFHPIFVRMDQNPLSPIGTHQLTMQEKGDPESMIHRRFYQFLLCSCFFPTVSYISCSSSQCSFRGFMTSRTRRFQKGSGSCFRWVCLGRHFRILLGDYSNRIHVYYICLHLAVFNGKCRQIYHTWILWDCEFQMVAPFVCWQCVTCDQTLQWLVGSVKSPRDLAICTAVSNPYK